MRGDILAYRYWNSNGVPVAIVAVEGSIEDMGAYIGGDPKPDASEEATIKYVLGYGAKLSREDAFRFLPLLAELTWLSYRD